MRLVHGLVVTLALSPAVSAQAPPRFSLSDAIAEAIAKNPDITAAQKCADASRQRPVQEWSLPDPMVSAGYKASGNQLPDGLGTEPIANIGIMLDSAIADLVIAELLDSGFLRLSARGQYVRADLGRP